MPADVLTTLRHVNESLRSALQRFHPSGASMITAEDFSALLVDLMSGGDCLRNLKAKGSSAGLLSSVEARALEQETSTYRDNLEQLKNALPDVHARLLAEKARLRIAEKHIATASAWAHANGKTL